MLALPSCESLPSGPAFVQDGFSVDARLAHLTLRNDSPSPIHYVALEQGSAALIDLYFDPEQWPMLAPGEEKRIPYAELNGYDPGDRRALIFWWTEGEHRDLVVVELR